MQSTCEQRAAAVERDRDSDIRIFQMFHDSIATPLTVYIPTDQPRRSSAAISSRALTCIFHNDSTNSANPSIYSSWLRCQATHITSDLGPNSDLISQGTKLIDKLKVLVAEGRIGYWQFVAEKGTRS